MLVVPVTALGLFVNETEGAKQPFEFTQPNLVWNWKVTVGRACQAWVMAAPSGSAALDEWLFEIKWSNDNPTNMVGSRAVYRRPNRVR